MLHVAYCCCAHFASSCIHTHFSCHMPLPRLRQLCKSPTSPPILLSLLPLTFHFVSVYLPSLLYLLICGHLPFYSSHRISLRLHFLPFSVSLCQECKAQRESRTRHNPSMTSGKVQSLELSKNSNIQLARRELHQRESVRNACDICEI